MQHPVIATPPSGCETRRDRSAVPSWGCHMLMLQDRHRTCISQPVALRQHSLHGHAPWQEVPLSALCIHRCATAANQRSDQTAMGREVPTSLRRLVLDKLMPMRPSCLVGSVSGLLTWQSDDSTLRVAASADRARANSLTRTLLRSVHLGLVCSCRMAS